MVSGKRRMTLDKPERHPDRECQLKTTSYQERAGALLSFVHR